MTDEHTWSEVELGDVIDLFDSQRIPLSGKERSLRQGKYPYFGASGVIDYIDDYIFDGEYLLVAEDGENLNSRKLPIAFWGKGKFWVNNHAHILRGKKGLANTDFIKHWLLQANISGYITGAAQPKLNQANLCRIKLALPPIEIQNTIAEKLSNYDSLIDNNNRRIAILEDMAQSLYREWFVNFRYPNHKDNLDADGKPKLVDSPLGQIPEGWEVKEFSESFDFWNGKKCAKSEVGEFDLYGANGIVGKAEDWKYENAVIIGRVGAYCGAVEYCFDRFWGSDNTIIAKCKSEKNISYLFLLLEHFNLNKYAGGSAQPLLTQTTLKKLKYIAPPDGLVEKFETISHKFFEGVINLKKRNQNLKEQRDMLLPKLISGQVEL